MALAAAGCGGEQSAVGGAADAAPANALAFIVLNTDFEGDQWKQAQVLGARFPDGDEALRSFLGQLGEENLDLERDVKPAVGPELDVVVLPGESAMGEPRVALLTQPDDPAKLNELLERTDQEYVQTEIDGWTAVAENEATLDALREGDPLSGEDDFNDAMSRLPEDALVHAYVNAEAISGQAREQIGSSPQERAAADCLLGGQGTGASAFALGVDDDGARLAGAMRSGEDGAEEGSSELAERLPGGALAFVSARGLGERLRVAFRCLADADREVAQQIAAAELGLGLSIEEDLLPLIDEETAVAVYPGSPQPMVLLASRVEDEQKAADVLDRVTERASAFLDELDVRDVDIDGVEARQISIGGVDVTYMVANGMLLVSNDQEALSAVRTGGEKLATDESFQGAREAAGAPDETTGLAYADLGAIVSTGLQTLMAAEGGATSPELRNLEPLRSLFLWSESDGDWLTFEGLLQIG